MDRKICWNSSRGISSEIYDYVNLNYESNSQKFHTLILIFMRRLLFADAQVIYWSSLSWYHSERACEIKYVISIHI
jgi:hypothetical protein